MTPRALTDLSRDLQARRQPLSFVVTEISLIWRDRPPNDVFRVDRTIPLSPADPDRRKAYL